MNGRQIGVTRVQQRTLYPRWSNETFVVPLEDYHTSRNLSSTQKDLFRLEVFDYDWWSFNDFLGHVELSKKKLVQLAEEAKEQPIRLDLGIREFHGLLHIKFGTLDNFLRVQVWKAECLEKMDPFGLADPFVKVFFGTQYLGQTPSCNKTLDPLWSSGNCFQVDFEIVRTRIIEIVAKLKCMDRPVLLTDDICVFRFEVYDFNRWRPPAFMGTVRIPVEAVGLMVQSLYVQVYEEPAYSESEEELSDDHSAYENDSEAGSLLEKAEITSDDASKVSDSKVTKEKSFELTDKTTYIRDKSGSNSIISEDNNQSSSVTANNQCTDSIDSHESNNLIQTTNSRTDKNDGDYDSEDNEEEEEENVLQKTRQEIINTPYGFKKIYLMLKLLFLSTDDQIKEFTRDHTFWTEGKAFPVHLESGKKNIADRNNKNRGQIIVRLIFSSRGNVIKGLDEGIRHMSLGETASIKVIYSHLFLVTYIFYSTFFKNTLAFFHKVRYDHAYSSFCVDSNVLPRSNIVFTAELLRINGW